jgi:hypothetical protein
MSVLPKLPKLISGITIQTWYRVPQVRVVRVQVVGIGYFPRPTSIAPQSASLPAPAQAPSLHSPPLAAPPPFISSRHPPLFFFGADGGEVDGGRRPTSLLPLRGWLAAGQRHPSSRSPPRSSSRSAVVVRAWGHLDASATIWAQLQLKACRIELRYGRVRREMEATSS